MHIRFQALGTEMKTGYSLKFHTLHIPFRQRFAHASADRAETSSVWIEATGSNGQTGWGEACPRPYVTGETLETARAFFNDIQASVLSELYDADSLRHWVTTHAPLIDRNPAAWCAIELALIDLFSKQSAKTAEAWLELPATLGTFQYSAVLGDADLSTFAATFKRYRETGMTDFKLKLSGKQEHDQDKLTLLKDAGPAVSRLRLDANNLWDSLDTGLNYLAKLNAHAFAIEEPLTTRLRGELASLAQTFDMAIILDESLCRIEELADYAAGTNWIPNVRVSKMGGVLRALAIVDAARARDMSLIIGAQVGETSLLTRAALTITRAAGKSLIAQEGAFGTHLLEQDVCTPSLIFGAKGLLQFDSTQPGWGLACSPDHAWLRE